MKVLRKHHISFKNAFAGIFWALRTQPNFRVHFFFAAAAIALGLYFGVPHLTMAILLFTILLGLAAEMINTAIESVTDLVTRQWRQEAKIAKDVSAGMMLLVAVGAVGVAIFIFAPYFTANAH